MGLKPLSQTNEMIREDLYGAQARCVYEICPYGESHEREPEASGTGCLLGFKVACPDKEGCEVFFPLLDASCSANKTRQRVMATEGGELN